LDVNANQLFGWRKLYREGRLEVGANSTALIPVKITQTLEKLRQAHRLTKPDRNGIIDIDLGHARVRIEGAADPDCVRAAVEGLIR
jgi:transposase